MRWQTKDRVLCSLEPQGSRCGKQRSQRRSYSASPWAWTHSCLCTSGLEKYKQGLRQGGEYPSNSAIAQKGAGQVGKRTNSALQHLPSPAQPTVLAQAAISSRFLVPPLASKHPAQCTVSQCLPLPRRTACTKPAFSSMIRPPQ